MAIDGTSSSPLETMVAEAGAASPAWPNNALHVDKGPAMVSESPLIVAHGP